MRSIFSLSLFAALLLVVGDSASSNETSQLPVTNGLALWLDASQLTGMTDGQQVNTWTDISGLGNHAIRQSGSSAGYPMYVADGLNGKPVVRFNSRTINTGDYFRFNRISNIRTVFWVVKEKSGASDGAFLLGDQSTYHFHRSSANGPIWSNTYASANVKNGATMLMGTPVNGTTTALPADQFQVLSLVTTGNVQANQICQDRVYHGSWQGDIAEIIIYTTALSPIEEAAVGKYLAAKYGLSTAYTVTPTITATTPSNGGTIDAAAPSVSVTFSKLMNHSSVEAAFSMGGLSGFFSWSGNTLTFKPSLRLHPNTTYTVSIGTGAQALDGTSLDAPYSFVVSTPSGLNGSALTIVCDDAYELYLNGILVGSGNNWKSAQKYSNIALVPGKNVIAVKGVDTGGVAALLAEMTVNGRRLGTSRDWKVALTPPANWADPMLDDTSWASATEYGAYGVTPWNASVSNMPTDTPARWIWSSNNNVDNTVYLRWTIDTSTVSSAPTNLTFSHVSDRVVVFSWQPALGANPFDYYEVYRDGAFIDVVGTPGYRDTILSPLTQYSYTVRSVNALGGTSPFSAPAVATTLSAPPIGTGTGLQGKYYASKDLTNRILVRTDAQVAFDWGSGAPATGVGADNFSVRWEGQILPRYSEQYTFYTLSDDGVRLWVDGQLLVSDWNTHAPTENKGLITLQAGRRYDIRMEYFESTGGAVAKLLWESASQLKELVPTSQLYPAALAEVNLITSAESAVSPAWVEGRNVSDAVSVKFSVNSAAAQDVVRENAIQWYADTASALGPYGIPLDKDAATTLSVTGLAASTQAYYYRVRATNSVGDSVYSNEATATGQATAQQPVGPAGYIYCAAENQTFTLPGTCDVAYGANGKFNYLTGRSGTITFNNATFGDPIVGTAKAGFYKPAADLPAAPSNLRASVVSANQIALTWTDNASNETGFKLERKLGDTGTWAQIATLDANAATYSDTANDCGTTQTQSYSLVWTPTVLNGKSWSRDEVVIRVNDSLLFTVEAPDPQAAVKLDTNNDKSWEYTGRANMKFPWKYTTPGHYTVTAWLGTEECGTLTVTVLDVNLHGPIACEVNYTRSKTMDVLPLDSRNKVTFLSADTALLQVSSVENPASGADVTMRVSKRGSPVVQSRVGGSTGPLIRCIEIDEFTRFTTTAVGVILPDKGQVGVGHLVMHPYISDIRWDLRMFAHRSTFAGGITFFSSNTSDLGSGDTPRFRQVWNKSTGEYDGVLDFEIEVPIGETKYCLSTVPLQHSSPWVQIGVTDNDNGDPVHAKSRNTLTFMISESNEQESSPKEPPEIWRERSAAFVSGEDLTCSVNYAVELIAKKTTKDTSDQPAAGSKEDARYVGDSTTSSMKSCNSAFEDVLPNYLTGIKYGIYEKYLLSKEEYDYDGDSAYSGASGFMAVARLDANGPDTSTTTDLFPPYTSTLPRRSGHLVVRGQVKGQPVIVVTYGGEAVITGGSGQDQGTQQPSFYGCECNYTNFWTFEARDEGFDSNLHERNWYIQDAMGGARQQVSTDPFFEDTFPVGRWNLILEYTDRTTREVIGKAEIHSLVVEAKHANNVKGKPGDVTDKAGATFELRGKCDSAYDLDASVYVTASGNGARGRVSLDGYPQNEYWFVDDNDSGDIPQVLSVKHDTPVKLYVQGYRTASQTFADRATLKVDGQALLEVAAPVPPCNETLEDEPVKWYWQLADQEQFAGVAVRMNYAVAENEIDGGAIVAGDYPANVGKIQNPAVLVIESTAPAAGRAAKILVDTQPALGDDDDRMTWTIESLGGNAAFTDQTGRRALAYGTAEGMVRLDAKLKYDAGPCMQYRALAAPLKQYLYRANFLSTGPLPGGGAAVRTPVTVSDARDFIAMANVIARQVGIELVADTNITDKGTLGDPNNITPKIDGGAPVPGFWDVTGVAMNEVRVVDGPSTFTSAQYNVRAGIIAFDFVESFDASPNRRGQAVYWPGNPYCLDGSFGIINHKDEANIPRQMQTIRAPFPHADPKPYLVFQSCEAVGFHAAAVTFHEICHGLGLNHRVRNPHPPVQIQPPPNPPITDDLWPDTVVYTGNIIPGESGPPAARYPNPVPPDWQGNNTENLLYPYMGNQLDIDIPQALVARASALGPGNGNPGNLQIAAAPNPVHLTRGATMNYNGFTVTRNGNTVANAHVEFSVLGAAPNAIITSNVVVSTNGAGTAPVSFRANGPVGSEATILAVARQGADMASTTLRVIVDSFVVSAASIELEAGTSRPHTVETKTSTGAPLGGVSIAISGVDAAIATVTPTSGATEPNGSMGLSVTGVSAGTTTATVTANYWGESQTITFTITVTNDFRVSAASVEVSPELSANTAVVVTTASGAPLKDANVAITGFAPDVASLDKTSGTTDAGGRLPVTVTGRTTLSTTQATVTVTYKGVTKTTTFSIKNDIYISVAPVTVNIGASKTDWVTVKDVKNATIAGAGVSITGYDGAIATVNPTSGTVDSVMFMFSVTGVSAGTTTATVTVTTRGATKTTSFAITVNNDFTLSVSPVTVNVGASALSWVTVQDSQNQRIAGAAISISGFDSGIATINPTSGTTDTSGMVTYNVTGVAVGTTTATVSATVGGTTKTKTFTITVNNDFTLSVSPVTVNVGASALSWVTVQDSQNQSIAGAAISISGFDSGIATINPTSGTTDTSGVVTYNVTGVAVGTTTATVSATVGGTTKTKTFTITVNNDFTLSVSPVTVNAGASVLRWVTVQDSQSRSIAGAAISITGFDSGIATINPTSGTTDTSGMVTYNVTGVTVGTTTATVSATVGGTTKTKTFGITVQQP